MDFENIVVIDGNEFSFTPGETILQIAQQNGIEIPTLCYLKRATPNIRCGMCVSEVEGSDDLVRACATPAISKMVVKTSTPRVIEERRKSLHQLLSMGYHNCLVQETNIDSWTDFQLKAMAPKEHEDLCPAYGTCELQDMAIQYQVKATNSTPSDTKYPIENANPFIVRDFSRCILCGRCVKACNEIQVNDVINFGHESTEPKIVTEGDQTLKESDCVFCGECVQACPVGALVEKEEKFKIKDWETKQVPTTCTYCGVGCQIRLHVRDNQVVRVSGVEEAEPNYGSLCVKGRYGFNFINSDERLKTPLIKENGKFKEATWDEALSLVAEKLGTIKEQHGSDSIGFLTSARMSNEDNYIAQKFSRAVIKTNNIDHCARL
jgi:predicted molibdopterin-dependent oxidoreductase YjgC